MRLSKMRVTAKIDQLLVDEHKKKGKSVKVQLQAQF
jgi:hypothetical protein